MAWKLYPKTIPSAILILQYCCSYLIPHKADSDCGAISVAHARKLWNRIACVCGSKRLSAVCEAWITAAPIHFQIDRKVLLASAPKRVYV